MFSFRDTYDLGPGNPRVEVAFTDASYDLQSTIEKVDGFSQAIAAVEGATGTTFARMSQVHGADVIEIDEAWAPGPRHDGQVPVADALVTTRSGIGLMVRVADCVPVLIAGDGVVGAVHAGRKGVVADVVTRTVERMRALGAEHLHAWIGPHICGRCYEVPAEMRAEVAEALPATWSETSWGTPALDLGAGVAAQLSAAGVASGTVGLCTLEEEALHSYRRHGAEAGRLAGLVWMP
jgi:YfiH family protein